MNTFGTSTLQLPLYDPREVISNRARFRRDANPMLEYVNCFYCPLGRYPFKGWILLSRSDYNKLDPYSTSFQLNIGDTSKTDNISTLKNLSIVQAQCVTRGLSTDTNALYLLKLTDARGILTNKWFEASTTAYYNIRAPAYPQIFHIPSLNSGTTWTWSTMLQNLWEQMPSLGTWPGLPYQPVGTPEGFWLSGVTLYRTMCDILDHIGMAVAVNLTQTNPYTIVSTGGNDTNFTALQNSYLSRLEDDYEWLDVGAGRVPKTIVVMFKQRSATYGTEETVRRDSTLQWSMNPIYSVSISAPATFTNATGKHYIWSDFTVRIDENGNTVTEDTVTASAIATERVSQYFDRIYSRTSGFMTQVYTGALPFYPGAQVDGVKWYQDYSPAGKGGWRTTITREYPVFPEIYRDDYHYGG